MNKWKTVGYIGVDSGICWIGDPCYILHKNPPPKDIASNWISFCEELFDRQVEGVTSFKHVFEGIKGEASNDGLGVAVRTGYGDGFYPVQIKYNKEGRISEVRVKFI